MRPVTQTAIAAVAAGAPVVLDYRNTPENAGIQVALAAPSVLTYKVQYSNDDPFASGFDPSTATWFDHPTLNGQTTSQYGSLGTPARMVRLNVTAWTSGSATLTVVQSGN
jgi:hypothetical protein